MGRFDVPAIKLRGHGFVRFRSAPAIQAGSNASKNKAYDAGYEKARSDSAKQQFQTLIDRQRTGPQLDDREHVRLLEVPLPERQENGVILAPSTATIRIQE